MKYISTLVLTITAVLLYFSSHTLQAQSVEEKKALVGYYNDKRNEFTVLGKKDSALHYTEKASKLLAELGFLKGHFLMETSALSLLIVSESQQDLFKRLDYCLSLADSIFKKPNDRTAELFHMAGSLYLGNNEPEKVEKYLEKSLAEFDASEGEHFVKEAFVHISLGNLYRRTNQTEKALNTYMKGLNLYLMLEVKEKPRLESFYYNISTRSNLVYTNFIKVDFQCCPKSIHGLIDGIE